MIPDVGQWAKTVNEAQGDALLRSAFLWLCRWAGAGFPSQAKDGKILVTNGDRWKKTFPDGPSLIEALRKEFRVALESEKAACLLDSNTRAMFWDTYTRPYFAGVAMDLESRLRRIDRIAGIVERGYDDKKPDSAGAVEIRKVVPELRKELERVRAILTQKPQ